MLDRLVAGAARGVAAVPGTPLKRQAYLLGAKTPSLKVGQDDQEQLERTKNH